MIHIDLFSGIGGFALAVDEVFPRMEHIFCEIDKYCQTLLKKRFKGARIYGDIRTLSRERLTSDTYSRGQAEQELQTTRNKQCGGKFTSHPTSGKSRVKETGNRREDTGGGSEEVFILTGGFPCQPFSQAGKRKGTDDNRYLWPEMLRVIRDFKPTWVIAENVRGLLTIEQGMVFEQVCLDLEGEGYEVQPFIIPAVAVNAPHRRDRVWFVGHSKGEFWNSSRLSSGKEQKNPGLGERLENKSKYTSWEEQWIKIATELCRVDDGLPAELDGLKLSKSRHRVERLKALGNAIVPQVAVEIMKGIKACSEYRESGEK